MIVYQFLDREGGAISNFAQSAKKLKRNPDGAGVSQSFWAL